MCGWYNYVVEYHPKSKKDVWMVKLFHLLPSDMTKAAGDGNKFATITIWSGQVAVGMVKNWQ